MHRSRRWTEAMCCGLGDERSGGSRGQTVAEDGAARFDCDVRALLRDRVVASPDDSIFILPNPYPRPARPSADTAYSSPRVLAPQPDTAGTPWQMRNPACRG